MCFYDQIRFSCGDYKWSHFRQQCNRKYRTGETCGMKLVIQRVLVEQQCKNCDRLDTIHRRRQAEAMGIDAWRRNTRSVPRPLTGYSMDAQLLPLRPVVPSIISVGGDTLQAGIAGASRITSTIKYPPARRPIMSDDTIARISVSKVTQWDKNRPDCGMAVSMLFQT